MYEVEETTLPYRLPKHVALSLKKELQPLAPGLAEARKLANMPHGRLAVTYAPDFISTSAGHLLEARAVAFALVYDAIIRRQEGNIDGALVSAIAMVNAARSTGDEPRLIAYLIRLALLHSALYGVEGTIAHGQPSPGALEKTQSLLEDEARQPLFTNALRGQRAGYYMALDQMRDGKVSTKNLKDSFVFVEKLSGGGFQERVNDVIDASIPMAKITHSQAWLLRYFNTVIATSKAPVHEHLHRLHQLNGQEPSPPSLVRGMVPMIRKVTQANLRAQARLRCTITGLAAERFRQEQGRWPHALDELVAGRFLAEMLLDPFDGKPLRYRPWYSGIVFYSIGPDGNHKGDTRDNKSDSDPDIAFEFRLWNPEQRALEPREGR